MPAGTESHEIFYFPARGRAEIHRMLLSYGNMDWTERNPKEWPKEKNETPFGQLPVLKVHKDGKDHHIAQSNAITRYLADRVGLLPKDPLDRAFVDSIWECCVELQDAAISIKFKTPDDQKEAASKKFKDEGVATFVKNINKYLEKNGNNGYFVGSQLTLAEFGVTNAISSVNAMLNDLIKESDAPNAFKVMKNVSSNSNIQKYMASDKRPKK